MTAMIVAPQPKRWKPRAGAEARRQAVDRRLPVPHAGRVDPQMAGIGGLGSMHVYMSGGAHEILNLRTRIVVATPDSGASCWSASRANGLPSC